MVGVVRPVRRRGLAVVVWVADLSTRESCLQQRAGSRGAIVCVYMCVVWCCCLAGLVAVNRTLTVFRCISGPRSSRVGRVEKGRLSSKREPEGGGVERSGFGARPLRWFWGGCGSGGRRHEARSSRNLIARNSVTGCCTPPDSDDRFGIRGFTIDRGGAATHRRALGGAV